MQYWPQIATNFKVRFQIRPGRFCHLPEKGKLRFIDTFFTIFENIPLKSIKSPFHCRITHLCSDYTAKMTAIFKSVKIFSSHPVEKGDYRKA